MVAPRSGACPTCENSFPEISPRLFSFNNPFGACDGCSGLGLVSEFDPARIVPDETLSLSEGAIAAWDLGEALGYYRRMLETLADDHGIDLDKPWKKLTKKARSLILAGDGRYEIEMVVPVAGRKRRRKARTEKLVRTYDGVLGDLSRREEAASGASAAALGKFKRETPVRLAPATGYASRPAPSGWRSTRCPRSPASRSRT